MSVRRPGGTKPNTYKKMRLSLTMSNGTVWNAVTCHRLFGNEHIVLENFKVIPFTSAGVTVRQRTDDCDTTLRLEMGEPRMN